MANWRVEAHPEEDCDVECACGWAGRLLDTEAGYVGYQIGPNVSDRVAADLCPCCGREVYQKED